MKLSLSGGGIGKTGITYCVLKEVNDNPLRETGQSKMNGFSIQECQIPVVVSRKGHKDPR
jgi:hypothetical protein